MTDHETKVAELAASLDAINPDHLPPHLVDQLEAAANDTYELTHRLGAACSLIEPGRWSRHPRTSEDRAAALEGSARVILAIDDARICPHLRAGGPQPATARLPLRRVDCQRCVATRQHPPAEDADRCDWCGARNVEMFTPVVLSAGPVLAVGDACPSCAAALTALVPDEEATK